MALLDNRDMAKGIAIGIGVALLAPVLLPAVAGIARPLARAAMKSGIIAYEKGREAAAELREVVEDLMAEAQSELGHWESQEERLGDEDVAATGASASGKTSE